MLALEFDRSDQVRGLESRSDDLSLRDVVAVAGGEEGEEDGEQDWKGEMDIEVEDIAVMVGLCRRWGRRAGWRRR